MNKTYKIPALWMMCLTLLSCLAFTACDNGDELDTNQYRGGISLSAFGPCPVARGGELRFLGSGIDKVTAVVIPGCDDITDIKVISDKEIRVAVPQTAEPGLIVLKTPNGEITTKTELNYTEPIGLESFAPAEIKPGNELTISGEYLNLIKEIIFADEVTVASDKFVSQSRKEIKVIVPDSAQTGKFILSDGAEIPNWIYSDEEVKITLPSVEEPLNLTNRKPGDAITVIGKDFDLIKKVRMPNGTEVEFKVEASDEGDKLTFVLPDDVSNGDIVVLPASEVDVVVATVAVATPSEIKAVPAENLRGGDEITLIGINMELIVNVTFPGVEEVVEPVSKSATEAKVVMPAAAISGDLLLNTASGTSVPVAIATLKPEFMNFAANAVSLGSDVVIQGKNLDLVVKVLYTGGAEVEVKPSSATELTVKMPTMNTESGVLTLIMANGEKVETKELTINAPEFCYIPVLPGEDEELKGGEIFTINVENGSKLTGVEVDGKAVQYLINGNTLVIAIPQMANANTKVKLISSNGEIEYAIAFIPATNIKNEVWSGLTTITWEEGGRVMIPASVFKDVPAGARMILHYAQKAEKWAQVQINYGDWSGVNFTEGEVKFNQTMIPTDIYGWEFANRSTPLVLTQEILDNIQAKQGDCEDQSNVGIIIQGEELIFSSITLEWEISLETTVWEGSLDMAAWSINHEMKPNTMFADAGLKKGMTLRLYFEVYGSDPKVKLFDGHWGALLGGGEIVPDSNGIISIPVDDDLATALTTLTDWGYSFIIQGTDCTLKKITIE